MEFPPNMKKNNIQAYEILRYMQKHFRTVTLGELADHFHFSEAYTSRLIKRVTGSTFTKLLTDLRMERAANYLKGTTLPIAAICESVGYLNPEHFSRTFKKIYRQTPGAYRSSLQE